MKIAIPKKSTRAAGLGGLPHKALSISGSPFLDSKSLQSKALSLQLKREVGGRPLLEPRSNGKGWGELRTGNWRGRWCKHGGMEAGGASCGRRGEASPSGCMLSLLGCAQGTALLGARTLI